MNTTNTINTDTLIQFLLQQQKVEKSIELNTAYKIFMDHLSINNRQGTIEAYQCCLKPVYNFFNKNNIFRTNQITDEVINKFILDRKPFVKNVTINKEIIGLKAMLNLLIKLKYIDGINFSFTKLKEEKPTIPQINKEDLNKIIEYLNQSKVSTKYKLIFFLILTTGIRTNELVNIKNKNIDLNNMTILLDFTKTGHSRYIYINPTIENLIKNQISQKTYLFNDEDGNQLSANAVRMFFKHLRYDLDIEVLSPHKLRHYYATNLYNKSLDIHLVSKLLGHTNIKTTEIYLDVNDKNNQIKNDYYNPVNDLVPLKN